MEVLFGTGKLNITNSISLAPYRYNPKVRIQFYGRFNGLGSISNVCRQWCLSIKGLDKEFGIHDYSASEHMGEPALEVCRCRNPNAPIAIFYGFPHEMDIAALSSHDLIIGAFVCETDRINDHWVTQCNKIDLIIVPSQFCRDVFSECGVTTPILVVPHGLESEFIPYPVELRSRPFTFYNVFSMHSNLFRKFAIELVEVFLQTFQNEDVRLTLRTEWEGEILQCRYLPGFDQHVIVLPVASLCTEDYARYFSSVHCTVHPSRSEGFGMVPLQSLACATPVIATHETGLRDFLDNDNSLKLNTRGTVAGNGFDQQGCFPDIDRIHLAQQMRETYENWSAYKEIAMHNSGAIVDAWSWESVLSRLNNLLNDLAARGVNSKRIIDQYVAETT